MQVSSQSWPKRMMTRRSSSARIAWSTAHPECRCGNKYDIFPLSNCLLAPRLSACRLDESKLKTKPSRTEPREPSSLSIIQFHIHRSCGLWGPPLLEGSKVLSQIPIVGREDLYLCIGPWAFFLFSKIMQRI
jgi:hypothetical protein